MLHQIKSNCVIHGKMSVVVCWCTESLMAKVLDAHITRARTEIYIRVTTATVPLRMT